MTYTLTSVTLPTTAGSRAVAKFTSDTYTRVDLVGVDIRNSNGVVVGYPFSTGPVNVGPEGFTFISDPLTADLPPGGYTAHVMLTQGFELVQVGATQNVTVQAPPPPPGGGTTVPGKSVVFDAPFSDLTKWNVGRTSSYPGSSPQTNTGDNKLDRISPSTSAPDASGVFNATRYSSSLWNADLVTTEYVPGGGFELRPGDSVTADVTLGSERGAWPAIWTWGRDNPPGYSGVQPGHGEIDLFEYHTDNPNLLELSNHVRSASTYYTSAANIKPGTAFSLRVDFGLTTNTWYINGSQVWADGKGVPSYWRAWPIVNLSVCAGQWHPSPLSSQTAMQYAVQNFKVWR